MRHNDILRAANLFVCRHGVQQEFQVLHLSSFARKCAKKYMHSMESVDRVNAPRKRIASSPKFNSSNSIPQAPDDDEVDDEPKAKQPRPNSVNCGSQLLVDIVVSCSVEFTSPSRVCGVLASNSEVV
jgi:hypothetical protein